MAVEKDMINFDAINKYLAEKQINVQIDPIAAVNLLAERLGEAIGDLLHLFFMELKLPSKQYWCRLLVSLFVC